MSSKDLHVKRLNDLFAQMDELERQYMDAFELESKNVLDAIEDKLHVLEAEVNGLMEIVGSEAFGDILWAYLNAPHDGAEGVIHVR